MRVFPLAAIAALGFASCAVAADTQPDKTSPSQVSPQSSHPGVEAKPGAQGGEAAKDTGTAPAAGAAANQNAPPGTNEKQASPGTDPVHDASGIKGAPGNKNGPAARKNSGTASDTRGSSSTSAN